MTKQKKLLPAWLSLSNPIGVSLTQSAYHAGAQMEDTLVITFTVTNHLPPLIRPDLDEDATLTDTLAALAAINPLDDPNTIRHVLLADELSANATFVACSPTADRQPLTRQMAWDLGDIAPLESVTATLTIQVTPPASQRVELDTAATAWGTYNGRAVSGQTCRAVLWAETLDGQPVESWLPSDANSQDTEIVSRACRVGADPISVFEYVRTFDYEAYKGSLRGARGTEWSNAGNSLDQSTLLIAMLRSRGVPARYRHGTLTIERAQELILSMFPTTGAVVGYVPEGAEVSEPANNAKLLVEAQDHWWVEAYLADAGNWVAMDPSFRYASEGQTFTTPEGEPLADIPDELRHKVSITLESEKYHQLSYLYRGLEYVDVLTATYLTSQLVGQPVTLESLVAREKPALGCLIFCWSRYTYTPYLRLGDNQQVVKGKSFWELLSDYPFGQYAVTAIWLHFDVTDADGKVTRYTRAIGDRIGAGPRTGELRGPKMVKGLMTADVLSSLGPGVPSLIHEFDSHTIYFNPSWMGMSYAAEQSEIMLQTAQQVPELPTEEELTSSDVAVQTRALRKATRTILESTQAFNRSLGASYVTFSDSASKLLAPTSRVVAYPDSPRITIASTINLQELNHPERQSQQQILDLLHDSVRTIAYPGQATSAQPVYRMTRGMSNTFLETQVGKVMGGQPSGAATILQEAQAQGIPLVYVDADHLEGPKWDDISSRAKAHILDAVKARPDEGRKGYGLLLPERMVVIDGEPTIAWWQVDLETGETIGVGEDGTHQFLVMFTGQVKLYIQAGKLLTQIIMLQQRTRTWQGAWDHFWQQAEANFESLPEDATEEDIVEMYAETLADTKTYMSTLVQPAFFSLCAASTQQTAQPTDCSWLQ
jgi:hypothetical protein